MCAAFDGGGAPGSINYRRQFTGSAIDVAIASDGCQFKLAQVNLSQQLSLRSLPVDNSSEGSVVATDDAGEFALAARDGVVALAFAATPTPTLRLFQLDGGTATTPLPATPGAIALYLRGPDMLALVHQSDGTNYVWTVVNAAAGTIVDGGTSPCSAFQPVRAAVVMSEETLMCGGRSASGSYCYIMNGRSDGTSDSAIRAFFSKGDAGVLLDTYSSSPNPPPPPKTLVGAAGNYAISGYAQYNVTQMQLSRHLIVDSGFPIRDLQQVVNANLVELLVRPNGDYYLVGTTTAGGASAANLGGGLFVSNDGGSNDPFVAKFNYDGGQSWVTNLGGSADEVATHALLVNNQLLVVGKCAGTGTSQLCAAGANHWLVSLTP